MMKIIYITYELILESYFLNKENVKNLVFSHNNIKRMRLTINLFRIAHANRSSVHSSYHCAEMLDTAVFLILNLVQIIIDNFQYFMYFV